MYIKNFYEINVILKIFYFVPKLKIFSIICLEMQLDFVIFQRDNQSRERERERVGVPGA